MKREAAILVLLIAASGAVQAFMVSRAVTPAQDAVRFVAIAQRMQAEGVLPTLRDETEHPLYPLAIHCTYPMLVALRGEQLDNWALAAQCAAAVPLILLVIPLYLLLRSVVPAGPAATATLLFSMTREFAALGGSALADGWMLLFTCVFFLCVARILQRANSFSPWSTTMLAAGSGVSLALAATAHQLAFVSGAAALLIATILLVKRANSPGAAVRRLILCGTACAAGLGMGLGVWLTSAQATSPSAAIARLLGRETSEADELAHFITDDDDLSPQDAAAQPAQKRPRSTKWILSSGERMSFDKKDPNASIRRHGMAAGAAELGSEIPQAFGYLLGGIVLLGLMFRVQAWRSKDGTAAEAQPSPVPAWLTGVFVLYVGALLFAASRFGYLSARHLLPAVIVALPLAAEALGQVWERVRLRFAAVESSGFFKRAVPRWGVVGGVLVLACFPLLEPLHASRAPHRNAASWMAAAQQSPGSVLDTRGWTQFYSGRATHLLSAGRKALKDPQLRYIVLEKRELEFESTRAETLRELVAASVGPVATFAAVDGKAEKDVLVYEWNAERFARRKTRIARR